jgi:hypothetical protein
VEVDVVSLAAEFPNDNPALHCGASWVCLEVTGPAVAVREERPQPVAEPPIAAEPIVELSPVPVPVPDPVMEVIAAVEVIAEPEPTPIPEARISCVVPAGQTRAMDEEDDLDDEADIVVEDLPPLDETASVEGAVVAESIALPAASDDPFTILLGALVDVALGAGSPHVASVLPALLLEGRLEPGMSDEVLQALAEAKIASGTDLTPAFIAQMHAWRAILLGTSDDFGACGGAMLDEWAAELMARLLGVPSRAAGLRRDLRSHGVAAFGLVEAA